MAEESLDQKLGEEETQKEETSAEEQQTQQQAPEQETHKQEQMSQKETKDTLDSVLSQEEKENYLNKYVGDGKKYKSVDELAKSYAHAEAFINTLKKEKEEMESEMEQLRESSKLVEDFKEAQKEEKEDVDIDSKVQEALEKEKKKERELNNRKTLKQILLDNFDDESKAVETINSFTRNDPSRKELFDRLVTTDPQAAAKMLGVDTKQQEQPTQKTNTTLKEGSAKGTSVTDGLLPITWSEARKVRQEDTQKYKSHSFQQKLHLASLEAEKQGINFFNT